MRHTLLALGLSVVPWIQVSSAGSPDQGSRQWLMMVKTINTDPAKEKEFNEWYDDIDIPDVLKVPGYWRARRARELPGAPEAAGQNEEAGTGGGYVALYNIESSAIDKTIIDMLMATWKMIKDGRDTPLLEVTERVYYRQYTAPYMPPVARAAGKRHFLVLDRFDVAADVDAQTFDNSYDRLYQQASHRLQAVVRVTRYELYRVLMFEPKYAPRFLTLYEIAADSIERARATVADLDAYMHKDGNSQLYRHRYAALYFELKDVQRDAQ